MGLAGEMESAGPEMKAADKRCDLSWRADMPVPFGRSQFGDLEGAGISGFLALTLTAGWTCAGSWKF